MKFLGIEVKGNFEIREEIEYFQIWQNGNAIYTQFNDGYWARQKYDESGSLVYFEDSDKYWHKLEYDSKGNEIYYENSEGFIDDKRHKTKKVFRLWKFLEDGLISSEDKARAILKGWPQKYEGRTREEIRFIHPSWLVEEETK